MHELIQPIFADGVADPETVGIVVATWHWIVFGVFVSTMLILDLKVFHRKSHEPTLRESAWFTAMWAGLALVFNLFVWHWAGSRPAINFLTGYLIEWSLSMDNVFVFAVIFKYFKVPLKYQYRVLFWGILGAIFMRLAFVMAGKALIDHFDWVLWIFGLLLVYTGIKMAMQNDAEVHPEKNILMRLARRILPVTKESHGSKFFVHEENQFCCTPLFLVLLAIESTDLLFAIDSVPAIFGVTKDPFIVFTSNIFAILGLRALYFLLAGVMDMFHYLNYGLAAVLSFVGLKMIAEYWVPGFTLFHHHPWASLAVIIFLLGISIIASLIFQRRHARHEVELATDGSGRISDSSTNVK
jgi:tellurite resistance protein TerC